MWFYKRKLTMAPRNMLVLVESGDTQFVVEVSKDLQLLTALTPELELALKANSDCWAFHAPQVKPQASVVKTPVSDVKPQASVVVEKTPMEVVESSHTLTSTAKRRGRPAKTSK